MSYAWITTLALHLLPILMIWRTWKSDWNAALEKIVRVQIIGSLVYIVVYPLVDVLTWPDFHMGYISIDTVRETRCMDWMYCSALSMVALECTL